MSNNILIHFFNSKSLSQSGLGKSINIEFIEKLITDPWNCKELEDFIQMGPEHCPWKVWNHYADANPLIDKAFDLLDKEICSVSEFSKNLEEADEIIDSIRLWANELGYRAPSRVARYELTRDNMLAFKDL